MAVPIFIVEPHQLDGLDAILRGAEFRHLRVRRLQPGSRVVLGDGRGRQRPGVVVAVAATEAVVRFAGAATEGVDSPCRITLAQAALKAPKLDLLIEKATELGVSAIVVYTCERSLGAVSTSRRERWERIARSAAKQCGRATSPTITGPLPGAAVFADATSPLRLLFLEPAATRPAQPISQLAELSTPAAVTTIIGPEGGFTPEERQTAILAGCTPVTLGTRILRAETAAIAALALCQFLWGDLGRSPG
ncbi:16S rRNA (uracil(1498)-N(3))-methyltransferase [Candidatus Binatia bacterium]|nr:16S rRNA (uracil(1498)-N(3))-methyltransferase [Candidatus Binatia bacterium]